MPANTPNSPDSAPSRHDVFDQTMSGTQDPPLLPPLNRDHIPTSRAHGLEEFRRLDVDRETRIRTLWRQLPELRARERSRKVINGLLPGMDAERAQRLARMYEDELMSRCKANGTGEVKQVDWRDFLHYVDDKEAELWRVFHDELDLDGNGHLDAEELRTALQKAGVELAPATVIDFIDFLSSSAHSQAISFPDFRDFLLLMPRKASTAEIYRYYELKKFYGEDGRGAGRVNMEGDVSLSAEDRPSQAPLADAAPIVVVGGPQPPTAVEESEDHELEHPHSDSWLGGSLALKFLLAGGAAGAVSRTATAPFDRLKVFLITRAPESGGSAVVIDKRMASALMNAISRIYAEGGIAGFWTGNGLNLIKILPESAIKFLSYESAKRAFAKYWDKVEDSRDISGSSRFIAGGIGGLTSQLSIYPIETLKTQMMSATNRQTHMLIPTMKRLWIEGGPRAYYRGLGIGLVGVFPYSAIDMSTFEALKLAYLRSTGKEEPDVLAILAFGSISGSVGATSVYPLNLVRTRLQASGSSGHPQHYTGIVDVIKQTYQADGWRGFYRGLFPTLAKVVPAVSISYVVYERAKQRLGV